MAKTSKDVEYQNVTVRIPKQLYAEYKEALHEKAQIPTYAIRAYMYDVVENQRKEKRIMGTKKDTQPAKLVS